MSVWGICIKASVGKLLSSLLRSGKGVNIKNVDPNIRWKSWNKRVRRMRWPYWIPQWRVGNEDQARSAGFSQCIISSVPGKPFHCRWRQKPAADVL